MSFWCYQQLLDIRFQDAGGVALEEGTDAFGNIVSGAVDTSYVLTWSFPLEILSLALECISGAH
jgi:hypothetical protein